MSTDPFDFIKLIWNVLIDLLPIFWPYLLAIFGYYLFLFARKYWRRYRLSRLGLSDVDRLSGKDFETYLATRFRALGYKVEQTKLVGDYGADLILTREGYRTVVQAKRYKKDVGNKAVQEAYAAKPMYNAQNAIVVTNSGYTKAAVKQARITGVELWDRERLINELLHIPKADVGSIPTPSKVDVSTERGSGPAGADALCAICGNAVSEKVRDYCRDHADRFNGQVYCYEHQKEARQANRPGNRLR